MSKLPTGVRQITEPRKSEQDEVRVSVAQLEKTIAAMAKTIETLTTQHQAVVDELSRPTKKTISIKKDGSGNIIGAEVE